MYVLLQVVGIHSNALGSGVRFYAHVGKQRSNSQTGATFEALRSKGSKGWKGMDLWFVQGCPGFSVQLMA